jgi:predicted RNA-binding protein YlqC (UPF0109 family)
MSSDSQTDASAQVSHIPKKRALNDEADNEELGQGSATEGSGINGQAPSKGQANQSATKRIDDIRGADLARGEIVTRILLAASEMARVIGRGGEFINKIRGKTGASIKACDVENDDKVAVIVGEPGRVAMAFEMVLEKIAPQRSDYCSIRLLVSNDEAGRIVGARGANINELRANSRATQVQIEKLPTAIGHMNLRVMTVEGNLRSLAYVHVGYHRMFGVTLPFPGEPAHVGGRGGDRDRDDFGYPPRNDHAREPHSYSQPPSFPDAYPSHHHSFLSSDVLLQRGVPSETVRQLQEMKAYLSDNFQVGLVFADERASGQAIMHSTQPHGNPAPYYADALPYQSKILESRSQLPKDFNAGHRSFAGDRMANQGNGSYSRDSFSGPSSGANVIVFPVPSQLCGSLIGRGGESIHKVSVEFGVHIEVAKPVHTDGTRDVILKALDPNDRSADGNLARCKSRLLETIAHLQTQSQARGA